MSKFQSLCWLTALTVLIVLIPLILAFLDVNYSLHMKVLIATFATAIIVAWSLIINDKEK